MITPSDVTLANCDREPIHQPGAIQSHGALLAFDADRVLCHLSCNADALLAPARLPRLGERLEPMHLGGGADLSELLDEAFASLPAGDHSVPLAQAFCSGGQTFDVVIHRCHDGHVIVEFELQQAAASELASFALLAHRSMDRLKRQRAIDGLLSFAVEEIRRLTGFDRVMAYRFRHDDSGDVVAEACRDDLERFLGRRYPASDIPAQARLLYVANTLRLIADIDAVPVAVTASGGAPLDMSGAILRAVSPIHVEYLRNMGVAASMSLSIVVDGRLWGLLACHHYAPRRVPYGLRMACDVLAQLLASRVQTLLAGQRAEMSRLASQLSAQIAEQVLHADDTLVAIEAQSQALCRMLQAGAMFVSEGSRLRTHNLSLPAGQALLQWLAGGQAGHVLERDRDDVLYGHTRDVLPGAELPEMARWCGILALRFDASNGWIVLLRVEQIETVHWGGKPVKEYATGPLGPRLTPRGSFDLWKEIVRGQAVPWSRLELGLAAQLLDSVLRAHVARLAASDRLRTELLAMLGHDLRDPLQSISMAAELLKLRPGERRDGELGARIQSSSSRMQRLISQVLDLSRLRGGVGMHLDARPTDLVALLRDLVNEMRVAHPAVVVRIDTPPTVQAVIDPDRLTQVLSNLLSNARHHGVEGAPIGVRLRQSERGIELEVRNQAPPIEVALVPMLFDPFRRAAHSGRNRTGLGLGLYIAQQIVEGHGGTVSYSHDGEVVFTVTLAGESG